MSKTVKIVEKLVTNNKDVDLVVRDVFGKEVIIYPKRQKKACMLVEDEHDIRRPVATNKS